MGLVSWWPPPTPELRRTPFVGGSWFGFEIGVPRQSGQASTQTKSLKLIRAEGSVKDPKRGAAPGKLVPPDEGVAR